MNNLERARLERKVAIKDLVCDITSRRNYSRFLSDDISISFEILSKFLERLDIPFSEFSFYMHNVIMYENINEVYFHELIRSEKYELAYQNYYSQIAGKQLKTLYANKTIPLGIQLMKFKIGLISHDEALQEMTRLINLSEIVSSHVLRDDDIEALFLYIRICDKQTQEKIGVFALDALNNEKYIMLAGFYEQTSTILQLVALKTLTAKSYIGEEDQANIKKVAEIALKFHNRTKLSLFDVMLFQTLYDYIKTRGIKNKYIVFYYVASIIGSLNEGYVNGHKYAITQSDICMFYDCLNDASFMESSMYERLFSNGIV